MNNPIASAIKQVCDEKGIPQEQVIEALEAALAAAYRKDFGEKNQNIKVVFDIKKGAFQVFDVKKVVEDSILEDEEGVSQDQEETEVQGGRVQIDRGGEQEIEGSDGELIKKRFNPKTEVMISQALEIKPDVEIGEEIRTELVAPSFEAFGRMAAQTAKQVLIQKDREAERNTLYETFKGKEGKLLIGTVQRREEQRVLVDLGNRVTAVMPTSEQIARERYNSGDRLKVVVLSIGMTTRGPEIIVSRASNNFVKMIFEAEIPEVASGAIEIRSISRDPGFRSKVAVMSHQENIDPIGSCIGQRGGRIQTIISELGGEKIDVILYNEDPSVFIANALSPAKVVSITLQPEIQTAKVKVEDDQLSLAIGRMGQNVRLASQLTEWNIEIEGMTQREDGREEKKTHEIIQEVSLQDLRQEGENLEETEFKEEIN